MGDFNCEIILYKYIYLLSICADLLVKSIKNASLVLTRPLFHSVWYTVQSCCKEKKQKNYKKDFLPYLANDLHNEISSMKK